MISLLLVCLIAGVPLGVCRAEATYDCGGCYVVTHPWESLDWVTPAWPMYAAHIVASEARGVPAADIVIACTLIHDIEDGYLPFELHGGRWKGWGTPDEADIDAVFEALLTAACVDIPRYKFVGNFVDAQYWRSIGMIHEGPYDLYIGPSGKTVVGVPR